MGAIETELAEATGFKPPRGGFKDRQDELAALAKAAYRLDDDTFDEVTDEAADWVNNAIKAINGKGTIPEPDLDEAGEEAEAEEAAAEDEPAEDTQDEGAEEAEDETSDEEEASQAEADHEAEEAAEHKAAEAKKTKRKAGRPKAAKPKYDDDEPLPRPKNPPPTRYDNVDGTKDRFGVMIGTKTHDAVKMYEKGCTTKEIQDALGEGPTKAGGRFYNILKKLSREGHLVERDANGVFKLTHKDDIEPDKRPTKPRPTKQTRAGLKKRFPGKYK
jgi:hypothetical protein